LARERGDLLGLTKSDLIAFLSHYEMASTRSTMLSYLRAFYSWATSEGMLTEDPTAKIPGVRVPKSEPRPAARDDVAAMLHTADPRTRCMALLMVYGGLRCCEVSAFRPEHLTQNSDGSWWVDIPHSKGGHHQKVPFPADVAAEVLAGPSWTVGTQTVQKAVRDALRRSGSDATPHQLRHYYGTTALQSTSNLRQVQDMMRHASPATTARYTKVAASELTTAAEGLPRIA
jgi:integrase